MRRARTRKSTPIVALASSSGNHCLSEKRNKRLLFPTDELPMRSSLTLMSSCDRDCSVGAMVRGVWVEYVRVKSGRVSQNLRLRVCGDRSPSRSAFLCVPVPVVLVGHLWRWSGAVGAVVVQEKRK